MGRSKGKGRRGRARGRANDQDDDPGPHILTKDDMSNERFVSYYKGLGIIPEDEWDAFLSAMRTWLPTTFRVAGSRQTANTLNEMIKQQYVPMLSHAVFEDEPVPPPSQIPWYPGGLAWQFNVAKKVLRKSPEFKKFHSFLVFETEVGNISRQEAVSMIPPLFLDVQPHHKVIDMCAAPGSKTAQLLESLHQQDTVLSTSTPPGLLIANDSDAQRAHLLISQCARLPSPALMVTNVDASIYPIIKLPGSASNRGGPKKLRDQLLFDRILCDVPCSGDGTLRKNTDIWQKWTYKVANSGHGLQVRILQRAMRMLEDNGRIVYSTCSLNPIENEAVIAACLNSYPDFELVDVSDQLLELKRRPGVTRWKPTAECPPGTNLDSYAAFAQSLPEPQRAETKLIETHWPPSNVDKLALTRCLRIYPHLQDTGGFFVAVLEKKKTSNALVSGVMPGKRGAHDLDVDVPQTKKPKLSSDADSIEADEDALVLDEISYTPADTIASTPGMEDGSELASGSNSAQQKNGKGKGRVRAWDGTFKENPYTFLSPDDPALHTCISQLKFADSFPVSNVLVRNPAGEAARSLYLTNDLVKAVVQNNDYGRMRLFTCGTKVITKQEAGRGFPAQFRILGEGLPVVLPYVNPAAIVTADFAVLKVLLTTLYPLCTSFADPFKSVIENRGSGSHIVRFPSGQCGNSTLSHDLVLPLWKSNVSVSLMIDKKAKSALSLRVFSEDVTVGAQRRKPEASTPVTDTTMESVQKEQIVPEDFSDSKAELDEQG